MKILRFDDRTDDDRYRAADVAKLVKVCLDAGYFVSPEDAQKAWEAYSESMCAGWMHINEEYAFENMQKYLIE